MCITFYYGTYFCQKSFSKKLLVLGIINAAGHDIVGTLREENTKGRFNRIGKQKNVSTLNAPILVEGDVATDIEEV